MRKHLVIVESPAKAKTIGKYLGPDYTVLASYGHVRDLLPKEGAVDPDQGFQMNYVVLDRSERQIAAIAKALQRADQLILATDPDREGEAISWHLLEILRERDLLGERPVQRVVFHEITQRAVREAIAHPRSLSEPLINAQQARRALDYLVGFNLSPLLWRKIKRGLSAGRVQSPALRMICEREEAIEAFVTQEYWTLDATTGVGDTPFKARLIHLEGRKLEMYDLDSEDKAMAARRKVLQAAGAPPAVLDPTHPLSSPDHPDPIGGHLLVDSIERKQRKRYPAAPFTTSTLQQEASRKLGFTASRTMRIAQQLYEGIDLGSGAIGLISYMRTDSVTLAGEAIQEIRQLIGQRYGAKNVPEDVRLYKTKAKNAQEAHEAIRPTSVHRLPEEIRSFMSPEQARLYDLIWKRTVASQMMHATFDTVTVELVTPEPGHRLRANGSTLRHPGFIAVYQEGHDEARSAAEDEDRQLPPLQEGMRLELLALQADQHFTEPPPRFSEASLVKTLEEYGIGRPSTYASIISTLESREYVVLENKRFTPTDIGRIVNHFLTQHFSRYVDYDFTARLEDELDEISRGEKEWVPVLEHFWHGFHDLIEDKSSSVSRAEAVQSRDLGIDPASGRMVSVRMGRFGPVAQIGTRDDVEKPRFAGLLPGQKLDHISLEEALSLFRLPRDLGTLPTGEPVQVNIGRFGPYVKYGSQYVSIPKEDDVWTIGLERALEVIAVKQQQDAEKYLLSFPEQGIDVLKGRYGPYITDGRKNARIPKDRDPTQLTLEECQQWLAAAPERGARKSPRSTSARADSAVEGSAAADPSTHVAASVPKRSQKASAATKRAPKRAAAPPPAASDPQAPARTPAKKTGVKTAASARTSTPKKPVKTATTAKPAGKRPVRTSARVPPEQ